jgi:SAM-dependent methyltransferase
MQSMTSDLQVVPMPLGKWSCSRCGLAYRDPALPPAAHFESGYALYAHPPGGFAEHKRQSQYAKWIAASVGSAARVLDVGCGNGSLLAALQQLWPASRLMGCDVSPDAVRYAREAGLDVWTGGPTDRSPGMSADLVLSVNVIEHTADPHGFVAALASAVRTGGKVVLICPDGRRTGIELLIADHLFSFDAHHLDAMLTAAGLTARHWVAAPRELGAFQMVVASRGGLPSGVRARDPGDLLVARRTYLAAWGQLDAALSSRLPPEVVCFGAGEAAGLLRAYAPDVWARVTSCATDAHIQGSFGERRLVPLNDVSADATVLVAVRPQDQPVVADRLGPRFRRVVTWYDLVPTDVA